MIDFILSKWSFPSLPNWLIVFPIGIFIGILAGWIAGTSKEKWNLPVGYSRKIFHFIIFTLAGVMGWTGGFEAVQVYGIAIGFVVGHAVIKGHASKLYTALARPTDIPFERFYIITPFLMTALGGMTSNILFEHFAIIGYIATGWGDAVGEPVGTRWGRHKYRVPTLTGITVYRSLEGSLAVFITSGMGCMLFLSAGFDVSLFPLLLMSLLLATITTIVEAITFHSLDNLTIQISASGTCMLLFHLFGLNR